jgi:hypothetical protein
VAASLLRHVPAEAIYLAIHPADTPEDERGACLRELLDARSAAMAQHGLDMRTEARFGEAHTELLREIAAHEHTMLVLGIGDLDRVDWPRLTGMLEGPVARPLLIVRAGH